MYIAESFQLKKKVWRHHDLVEEGMEAYPQHCSYHGHSNQRILWVYWYFDLYKKY